MSDDLRDLLAFADDHAGVPMAIATVIGTWGSAPRPVGSQMLIAADGAFAGSVSGGCVENDVIAEGMAIAAGAPFAIKTFGVTGDQAIAAGLPCGGDIRVVIQPVADTGFPPALFDLWRDVMTARAIRRVELDLRTGRSRALPAADAATTAPAPTTATFTLRYLPPRRLLIIGAVQIAQCLARLAPAIGIEVIVNDPRDAYRTPARFPGTALCDDWPDDAVRRFGPGPADAVIVLSHDPKLDDPALLAAIATPCGYVGALGSRRNHAKRLERLSASGAAPADLARIDGPAGVPIGAIGPGEIAVSMLGGAIAAWRRDGRAAGNGRAAGDGRAAGGGG